jgi:hypothetical protein
VFLCELGFSLLHFDVHASYALGLLLLERLPVGEGPVALGLAVEDVVTTSFQAECEPAEEASELKAALGFHLFKGNTFDILFNEIESSVGSLGCQLNP